MPVLPTLQLTHPLGGVVEIYLQGAHVASWRRPGEEDVLFMSRESRFEPGVPIRGGVPVVFPQFSDRGPLPKHGFARTLPWEVLERREAEGQHALVRLRLEDDERTRALWPHPFVCELQVKLDAALEITLSVTNRGEAPFSFTSALHTYNQVGDVRRVTVEGLAGSTFLGVTPDGPARPAKDPLGFAAETDGVYAEVPDRLLIRDPELARTLVVEKAGFADAVVWNPWAERARALPDFGDDEYLRMLCVEPANIATPTALEPGETWRGTQRVRVEKGG